MNKEIEKLSNANVLIEAFNLTKKESIWKESVQRYEANLLKNTHELQRQIRNQTYKQQPFYEFTLNERGKMRYIKSMQIKDRVLQRALCDQILIPKLSNYLIYDNGASLKKKGIDFTRKRLEAHLHKYYRKEKTNEGYILLIDYSKFFDNIPHEPLIKMIEKKIESPTLMQLIKHLISSFQIDVSYLSEEEYKECMKKIYSALEHAKIEKNRLTGEKMMKKSIGIGSQISQICGVYYPTRVDTYCKVVKQMKYYGRYMDDVYIIDRDKERLKILLQDIEKISKELGLFLNIKKTQIVKLSHGFTFLKIKYNLTSSGKVIKRLCPKTITRERRKLKKYKIKLEEGKMSFKEIEMAYKSWRGNAIKYNVYRSIKNLDALYEKLFIEHF